MDCLQLRVIHNGILDTGIGHSDSMWFMHMGYGKMDEIKILDGESAL